ncbi:phosphodiester glycosidase family protein [Mesorhizobium sp. ZMM04-5]|uniref:Phosphodiester glycosidase family protein n=1 Tax=Mesorhizobium marinum TaxID=3228790 RepID=A0ABV3R538_9HYPH
MLRPTTTAWALALVGLGLAAALSAWWWTRPVPAPPPEAADGLPEPCRDVNFEAVPYIVCDLDLDAYDLVVRRTDAAGKAYGDPAALARAEPFALATNAGMYHQDLTPVGLYVEDGLERFPLNLGDAPGNFFMKPNGVFYVDDAGKAGVMEASRFARSGIRPRLATQSGPMLVIDGDLHPRFEENGASRYVRNGIGADGERRAVLAVSRQPVSLGSFARLFRDALGVKNALFFDGAISALHDGRKYLVGGGFPAGPMLAVKKKAGG